MIRFRGACEILYKYFYRVTTNLDPVARPGPDPGFNGVRTFYETIKSSFFDISSRTRRPKNIGQ